MNIRCQLVAAAFLLALPGVARAQGGPTPEQRQRIEEHRQQVLQHRQELLQQRREEMQQHRDELKQQRDQMLARRQEFIEQLRDLQKQLRDQVTSGQLTKDQAKDQLRAWRDVHKPTPPDGVRPPHVPNAGDK